MRCLAAVAVASALASSVPSGEAQAATEGDARIEIARGVVFHDRNRNGVRDRFERALRGVAVSNGRLVGEVRRFHILKLIYCNT